MKIAVIDLLVKKLLETEKEQYLPNGHLLKSGYKYFWTVGTIEESHWLFLQSYSEDSGKCWKTRIKISEDQYNRLNELHEEIEEYVELLRAKQFIYE